MPEPTTLRASARLKLSSRPLKYQRADGTVHKWRVPQLRVSNIQLVEAGFEAGDYVLVTIPKRGVLVILKDPDQHESVSTKLRRRRVARARQFQPAGRRPGGTSA